MNKKLTAVLSSLAMLSACMGGFMTADAKSTFFGLDVPDNVNVEGQYILSADNIAYAAKADGISEDYIPNAGTADFSVLTAALCRTMFSAQLAIQIEVYTWEEAYAEEEEQFLNEHTIDGQTYAEAIQEIYQIVEETGWTNALREKHDRIQHETQTYINGLTAVELEREPDRLRENGIRVTNTAMDGKCIYAIITAEQLEDFPASETLGYKISLATEYDIQNIPAPGLHEAYFLSKDGIVYSRTGEQDEAAYVPDAGQADVIDFTQMLAENPSAKFAVKIDTYTAGEITPEAERLTENGIEVKNIIGNSIYAIVTAEQLRNFPASDAIGYKIFPAPQYGDVQTDGTVDIMDAILITKASYGTVNLTNAQFYAADVNKNGVPDSTDSLAIMKYIIGLESLPA